MDTEEDMAVDTVGDMAVDGEEDMAVDTEEDSVDTDHGEAAMEVDSTLTTDKSTK